MEPKYEVEEGEARYHGLDDIALSYLDEKVESVLGHFQKDFEGGVSAENLGAKFGGYGSFLPTYQRSPSVLSPPRFHIHSHNMPGGSPKHLITEKNGVPVSGNSHSLLALRDGSVRKESHLPSKCLAKDEPYLSQKVESPTRMAPHTPTRQKDEPNYLNKSVTSTDEKTLKVGIKVHPHKNAAIYSALGLISPSSMESGEMSPDSQEACDDESPGHILEVMTSFPVAGGLLLSPLHHHLLALSRNGSNLGCDKLVAAPKNGHNNSTHASTSSLGNVNEMKGKKVNSISQSENFVEPKNRGNKIDIVSCLKKKYLSTDLNAKVYNSEGRKDSKGAAEKLKEVNVKATSHEQDKLKILDTKKKTSEGKKKSVGTQLSGNSASKLSDKGAVIKNKKNCGKDVLERTSGDKLKESKLDAHRELQASSDKSRLISGKIMKETSLFGIASTREAIVHTEEAPAAPFLIEDWVQCEKCEKWRLLPQGMKPDHLPSTWVCSMLNWLPGMNSCDFTEDQTTGALNALYENPNNLQTYAAKIEGGVVNPANACDTANLGRKKHKVKTSKNDELLAATNFTRSIQGEHVVIGDEKCRKKIKREPNLSDYKDVKKIKADTKGCNERELSTKKRKFKDSDYLETLLQSNAAPLPLGVSKVSIKDESSDGGFKKHKKCRNISQTEANESRPKARAAVTRTIVKAS